MTITTITVFLSKPQAYYGHLTAIEKYSSIIGLGIEVQDTGTLELEILQQTGKRTIVYAPGAWCKFELGGV